MNPLYADAKNISEESKTAVLNNASQISINQGREFQLVHPDEQIQFFSPSNLYLNLKNFNSISPEKKSSINAIAVVWEPYTTNQEAENYEEISELLQKQWALKSLEKYFFRGDETVLDVGCGGGGVTFFMAQNCPNGTVTGLDVSNAMLTFAKAKYPNGKTPNLNFVHGDACHLPKGMDLITLFNCLHWVPSQMDALKCIFESLNRNGTVIIVGPEKKMSPKIGKDMFALLNSEKWSPHFSKNAPAQITNAIELRKNLETIGFVDVKEHVEAVTVTFSNRGKFVDWVMASMSMVKRLPFNLREEFAKEYADVFSSESKENERGELLYETYKMEIFARKP